MDRALKVANFINIPLREFNQSLLIEIFGQKTEMKYPEFIQCLRNIYSTLFYQSPFLEDIILGLDIERGPNQANPSQDNLRENPNQDKIVSLDNLMTRIKDIDISRFILSTGIYEMKSTRSKHYMPEPFTLTRTDESKVLTELSQRSGTLIKAVSKSNLYGSSTDTPLIFAFEKHYFDIILAIVNCATLTPSEMRADYYSELLATFAEDGDFGNVRFLVEDLSADLNSALLEWSPLAAAASRGNIDIIQYLVSFGADVNAVSPVSALYAAAEKGYLEVCELLLEAGSGLNLRNDKDGTTPLMAAIMKRHFKIVQFLVSQGASLALKTPQGENALFLAITRGSLPVVEYLLKKNMDPNEKCHLKGRTPLHEAADKGSLPLCEMLLDFRHALEPIDIHGNSPLWYACEYGNLAVATFLVKRGASVNLKNKIGRTPIWVAVERGHSNVVKLLVENGALLKYSDLNGESLTDVSLKLHDISHHRSELNIYLRSMSNMSLNHYAG